ncbi:MAG: hypothetical protein V4708_02920 [Bacteroidota bacterium]
MQPASVVLCLVPSAIREANASPAPVFNTAEQTYVLVTLPVHALANGQADDQADSQVNYIIFKQLDDIVAFGNQANDQVSDQANAILRDDIHNKVREVLSVVLHWIKRAELFTEIGLSNHSTNRRKYLDPLISLGWVEMEYPDKKTNPNQRYKITAAGNRILNLISQE